jgi:hypothetical protein
MGRLAQSFDHASRGSIFDPEDKAMSFASTSIRSAGLEQCHAVPIPFDELVYPYTARVTRHDWQLLLDSWERLQPNADRFATVFFDTLFNCDPELRHLFGGTSLETQFIKFAHLLTELVSVESDPRQLGQRIEMAVHRYAGGSIDHDCAIRTAITAMLAEAALARLTSEVRMWWSAAYATVVTIIWKGARLSPHGRPTTFMRRTRFSSR